MLRFYLEVREARMRWFGHVRRRDSGYSGQRVLKIELAGRRKRRRQQRRFMDAVKEDMQRAGVVVKDARHCVRWT